MSYLVLTWFLSPWAKLRLLWQKKTALPQHILFIQTAKIGDYICTTPLIRALRAAYPQARLSLLVDEVSAPLARHQPGVDQVLVLGPHLKRGWRKRWFLYQLLRNARVDTVVCVSPNLSYFLLPFLAGIERRASIFPNFPSRSYRLAQSFLTLCEPHLSGRMTVETGMALLARMGVVMDLPTKEIAAAPGAVTRIQARYPALLRQTVVGLGVGSANPLKTLSTEKIGLLAQTLLTLRTDIHLLFLGSVAERSRAEALCAQLGSANVTNSVGEVPLQDLPALLDLVHVYVGVDSAVTYLADARNVPVIDMMGPANAQDQRPTGQQARLFLPAVSCAPCSHAFSTPTLCRVGGRACVEATDMLQVAQAAIALLPPREEQK